MLFALIAVYVIVLVAVLIVYFRSRQKATNEGTLSAEQRVAVATTAQEFLPFELIGDGVIKLDEGRYRAYLDIQPVNFYYMTGGEQEILEANFRHFLDGLRYPVQICVNSVPLDLSDHLDSLEHGQTHLSPQLQAYARELAAVTREWVERYAPITKRYTVVVCYDYTPDPRRPVRQDILEQQARSELNQRCQHVADALGRAGLTVRRLGDQEIASLFYQILNRHKGSEAAARNLWDSDLTSVYVTRAEGKEESYGQVQRAV